MNILKKIFNIFSNRHKTNMQKEIYEQSDVIFGLIKKYIKKDYSLNIDFQENINIKKISLIASGSSYHSATIASNFIRENVHMEAQSYYASEVALTKEFDVDSETLYVFISQSGETSDTNKALDMISSKTENTFAITNTVNSTLYNNTKYKILTHAGEEKSIASTKAMCAQLFCLLLLAIKLMNKNNQESKIFLDELLNVPEYINNSFFQIKEIKSYSQILFQYENAAILASGMFYPLAKEGALKIKETSYINTTAYPTGEFLHGHIAILNKRCAVISLVNNLNFDFNTKVLDKINKEYKTQILIISALPIDNISRNNIIYVPSKSNIEFLFSSLVILQLLAYETATLLNRNVDKPDGLTKVVK